MDVDIKLVKDILHSYITVSLTGIENVFFEVFDANFSA